MEDKRVFDHVQNWKPILWQRIKMFFSKTYVACDFGSDDQSVAVYFKKIGDNIFIIKTEKL